MPAHKNTRAPTHQSMGNFLHGLARRHMTPLSVLALLRRLPTFSSSTIMSPPTLLVLNPMMSTARRPPCRQHRLSWRRISHGAYDGIAKDSICKKRLHVSEASRACPEQPRSPQRGNEDHDDAVAQATLRWVRSTVIGLNLCPWAGGALFGGHMRVVVYPSQPLPLPSVVSGAAAAALPCDEEYTPGSDGGRGGVSRDSSTTSSSSGVDLLEGFVEVAAQQAVALGALDGEAAANATTLVVARPPLAQEFEKFLAVVGAVDDFIDEAGLRGTVQLATFHPRYRFEGSEEDDASNYTNRSPFPVLHLLLEDQVSAAVAQVGDPAKVWQRNVETTRKLGVEAMRRGVEACLSSPPPTNHARGEREKNER